MHINTRTVFAQAAFVAKKGLHSHSVEEALAIIFGKESLPVCFKGKPRAGTFPVSEGKAEDTFHSHYLQAFNLHEKHTSPAALKNLEAS